MTKVCVFGAGAVGGHMAARLAQAGVYVSVVARGAHLKAMQTSGLRLIAGDEDITVPVNASETPADLGPQDLVISTLKAQALGGVAAHMAPLLHDTTPVVYAVNGVPWWYFHRLVPDAATRLPRLDPEGALWRHVGPERVLGCVIRSPNELVEPGVIRSMTATNRFLVGVLDGSMSPRLLDAVGVMKQGLPGTDATPDIRADIWKKLLVNLPTSLLASLTTSTTKELIDDDGVRDLYVRICKETCAIAAQYGHDMPLDLNEQFGYVGKNAHRPSMLQDLLAGRPLELDAQLLAMQDLARQADVPVPTIDITVTLLTQRARSSFQSTLR
jgi:2-dehydropantoate 2-reductase